MSDLDELERLAGLLDWAQPTSEPWGYWPDADPESAYAQLIAALDPTTVLDLIAKARLGEAWARAEAAVDAWFQRRLDADPEREFLAPDDRKEYGLRLDTGFGEATARLMDWVSGDEDGVTGASAATPEAALDALTAELEKG